jgi:NitT/TauT family transport system ATP-binding protein
MVAVEQMTFAYGTQTPVFEGFDWSVAAGDAWAVIGPSGCGKSTLLYLVAGLRQPSAGSVSVDGQPIPRPRASSGLILQDFGLLPWSTVWDNVALVMRMGRFYAGKPGPKDSPRPYPRPDITPAQVDYWLTRLGIAAVAGKYPNQISGGQRQRTAIARSLLQQPDLLLMDEPFSSLDAVTREDLQRLTVELREETGVTTVIVTHNIEEAVYLGRHILVLGQPPNRTATIIHNPQAGQAGYRAAREYWERCADLREVLGGKNHGNDAGVSGADAAP